MQNYRNANTGTMPVKQPLQNKSVPSQKNGQLTRGSQTNNAPPNVRYERIRPMKPQPQSQHERSRGNVQQSAVKTQKSSKLERRSRKKLAVRDYFFGLLVGFVIFGLAAIIVCNALIGMIS